MTGYIMESERDGERLALETEAILVRRHLAWAGLRPHDSFLDAGCGSGAILMEAARISHPASVIGLDASDNRLRDAARRCTDEGLSNVRFHDARIAGVGSSGLPDAAFDHVWTRFVLEYQPEPAAVVRELARLAKPGGKVTLIDVEGNCTWHFGMTDALREGLDAVLADLARTGFDPHAGRHLAGYATAAGLVDVRHEIEPYHRIVGTPDPRTAAEWELKVQTIRDAYVTRLFPENTHRHWVFDAFLEFLADPETMTWSLLHLVQGTRPTTTT